MIKTKKKRILAEAIAAVATLLILFTVLYRCGDRLMPQYNDYGVTWDVYLNEPEDSIDVMFYGSSLVYCDVIPAKIYQQSGITSYVMAGPSQTLPVTYYYILESCKTQSPECIFVEVTGVFYDWYSAFSLVNVCNLPWSDNRILAAQNCEEGILRAAIYPLYEFHERIYDQLESEGEKQSDGQKAIMNCGYTYLQEAKPDVTIGYREFETKVGDACYNNNFAYLQKIAAYCEQEKIRLIFYLAPVLERIPEREKAQFLQQLERLPCLQILDLTNISAEIGIENDSDWYDTLHYNYNGAVKFSNYLSRYLTTIGLKPTDNESEALWQERVAYFSAD